MNDQPTYRNACNGLSKTLSFNIRHIIFVGHGWKLFYSPLHQQESPPKGLLKNIRILPSKQRRSSGSDRQLKFKSGCFQIEGTIRITYATSSLSIATCHFSFAFV